MSVSAEQVASALKGTRTPSGWQARCPAHDDGTASLSIGEGKDGRLLLNCHAGCDFLDILNAAGIERTNPNGHDHAKPRIVATYDYHDAAGKLAYQVVRFAPKDFRQRAANGAWSLKGIDRVPYRLPALLNASEVVICEGEKDADNLTKLGIVATTNPGGADSSGEGGKKWPTSFAQWFEGRHVTILPDHDEPGRKHAQAVASKLSDAAASIKVVTLPGLPPKGDVSDWLSAGGIADKLRAIIDAAPYWEATSEPTGDTFTYTLLRDLKRKLDFRELIKGTIPAGGFGCAYAEPGAGKTAIIVDMALHVAAGLEYRNRRVEQQPVIFLALEGHAGIANRIIAAADNLRITDAPFALITASDNFRDAKASQKAAAVAKELGGSPIIIIDTMTAALAGGSDCDPADVGALIENLKSELMAKGCTILVIHHSGKDASRGARGWSGLLAACDFEFELSRDDDLRVLRISKMRDGSDSQPAFCYRLHGVELGKDQHGDPVTSVVVEHLDDEEKASKPKRHSSKARSALNVLWTMIKDPTQSFSLPEDRRLKCVTLTAWEAACIKPGAICQCKDERDRRKKFRAAKDELQEANAIICDGGLGERIYPTPKRERDETAL